jgi:flagellar hook assembly protein FlgD
VVWDGTSNSGSEVSNGIYFFKISGENGEIKSGKMILKR